MASAESAVRPSARGERVQPRKDPRHRHIDATLPGTRLLNKDPAYEYRLVYKADENYGPDYYGEQGWEVCYQEDPKKDPDCLRFSQGLTVIPGNEMRWRGSLLMKMKKDRVEELRANGFEGDGGLNEFRRTMQHVRQGIVPNDPMFSAIRAAGAQGFAPLDAVGSDNSRFNEQREVAVRERA